MALLNLEESGNSDISVVESGSEYLPGDEEQSSSDEYERAGGRGSVLGEGSAVFGLGGNDDDVGEGSFGGAGGVVMMMMMMMMAMVEVVFGVVGKVWGCIGEGFC